MARKSLRVILLMALAAIALMVVGCETPKPVLSDFVMSKAIDKDTYKPTAIADTFTTTDKDIYCVTKVTNGTTDTEVKFDWFYLEGGRTAVTTLKLKPNTDGDGYLASDVTPPADGWPAGKYEVVVSMDGKKVHTVSFTVK